MSLYYEAAAVLANPDKIGGSLKSRIYKNKDLKSSPAQLFALIAEASKWSIVLKDVLERSNLLAEEKKLTPVLALLLTHDLLLSKNGVAAPASHVLKLAIARHKARLSSEFTKARIRAGHATLQAFRECVNNGELEEEAGSRPAVRHPRWVRVNTLKTTMAEQLETTFASYRREESLAQIMSALGSSKTYFLDTNIPNLLALPPKIDLSKSPAYISGQIIFQDKASCFPAYLLDATQDDGDVIDGCAAPGNKTTHLAAILSERSSALQTEVRPPKVIAYEKDKIRAGTLIKMVKLASADSVVSIKGGQDFLAANPDADELENVGAILLDPSCSGTGIVGRDDVIKMHLPGAQPAPGRQPKIMKGNKRKRNEEDDRKAQSGSASLKLEMDDAVPEETPVEGQPSERLAALSAFQLRILTHAMRFPRARKITYSTCSVHFEENEGVVVRALLSQVAQDHGWNILRREDQVGGMRTWAKRGVWDVDTFRKDLQFEGRQKQEVLDACIRCEKQGEDGTMGFFVAAFVRKDEAITPLKKHLKPTVEPAPLTENEEDEWLGFSDKESPIEHVVPVNGQAITEVWEYGLEKKTKKRRKKGTGHV